MLLLLLQVVRIKWVTTQMMVWAIKIQQMWKILLLLKVPRMQRDTMALLMKQIP